MEIARLNPNGIIQHRGGTATVLATENPLPLRREIMIEIDTGKIKVGDGVTYWNSLPYIVGDGSGSSSGETPTPSVEPTGDEAATNNETYVDLDLGSFSETVQTAISSGLFTGLNPGNYIDFFNVAYSYLDENNATQNDTYSGRMRLMHLNYLKLLGGANYASLPPHVAVAPDENLYSMKMNDTNTNATGYVGSKGRTVGLRRAKAIFEACFGASHILTYQEYLINAVTNSVSSGGINCDCTVELMDERMVFGEYKYDNGTHDATAVPEKFIFPHEQLAAFKLNNALIANGAWWWERNAYSSGGFCSVGLGGSAGALSASATLGVRPVAFIC